MTHNELLKEYSKEHGDPPKMETTGVIFACIGFFSIGGSGLFGLIMGEEGVFKFILIGLLCGVYLYAHRSRYDKWWQGFYAWAKTKGGN